MLRLIPIVLLWPTLLWAQGLGGFVSPGPLAHDHADLDRLTKCTQCHEPGAGVTATRCLACHDNVQAQIDARRGFHANLDENCQRCHDDHRGRDFVLVQLDEETFNHQSTGFALRGKHAPIDCIECHEAAPDDFTGLDSDCISCHQEPHGVEESSRELLEGCRTCHTDEDWKVSAIAKSIFDHDSPEDADYPLHGQHADVACEECHRDARFVPVDSEECTDCHDDPHGRQFAGRTCEDCHTIERKKFRIPDFDHSVWPLDGAHGDVTCKSCHGSGKRATYTPLPHDRCERCHDDVHEGQFAPRDCDACHSSEPNGFKEGVIDHDKTHFPLLGAHKDVKCDDCHGEGPAAKFTDLPHETCESCHEDIHQQRFAPDTCETCHTEDTWAVAEFDHDRTDSPLSGAHRDAKCETCHGEGEEQVLAPLEFGSCLDCHAETDPHKGHLAAETCVECHVTADWKTVRYDHAVWPLEGKHSEAGCTKCHEDVAYRGAKKECGSCHDKDTPPEHYEGACESCHDVNGWRDASFGEQGHDATGFSLVGAHSDLWCVECHGGREPKAVAAAECVDCHGGDDPHRNQLGERCEDCHRQDDWLRTSFRHAVTGYQLRGAHAVAECRDCHARSYAGTPDECSWCHDAEKPNDALHTDPLTQDCRMCHREHTWDDAFFSFGSGR